MQWDLKCADITLVQQLIIVHAIHSFVYQNDVIQLKAQKSATAFHISGINTSVLPPAFTEMKCGGGGVDDFSNSLTVIGGAEQVTVPRGVGPV